MTPSPDLIAGLRAARPVAPAALRMRVREIAAAEASQATVSRFRPPSRRWLVVALPAAAAVASAGVLGLARSGAPPASRVSVSSEKSPRASTSPLDTTTTPSPQPAHAAGELAPVPAPGVGTAAPDRAQQVSAALTVEVRDSDAVSRAAQDALALTQSLGGYVVSSSVTTGSEGSASMVVRVPVGKAQEAIVGLSELGRIVSQQVNVQDLQDSLDSLGRREATVRGRIARVRARLANETLDPVTEATLHAQLQMLRGELVQVRQQIAGTKAEARMSTIQLGIVTPGASGAVVPRSRIDRTLDEALNVLAWEGIVLLGLAVVVAPLAVAGLAVWHGRRLYRRREEERLLAAS